MCGPVWAIFKVTWHARTCHGAVFYFISYLQGPDLVGVVAPASGLTHMDRAEGRSKLAELKNVFGPFTVADATYTAISHQLHMMINSTRRNSRL